MKKYKDITTDPVEALNALADNKYQPVDGFAYWSISKEQWVERKFAGYDSCRQDSPFLFVGQPAHSIARVRKTKTFREKLMDLPDGYRQRAITYAEETGKADKEFYGDLDFALCYAFDWEDTPEGFDFWFRVSGWVECCESQLPPLPEPEKRFHVSGTSIHQGSNLAVSVWPVWKVDEERKEGESWLDMMERTKYDRWAVEKETEARAREICGFLNRRKKQNNDNCGSPVDE